MPDTLQVALKEWASVCGALEDGRQILLLRKGGVLESAGEFEVRHRTFLLFPTYDHQDLKMLKPEAHALFQPDPPDVSKVNFSAAATVTDIFQLESPEQMQAIDDEHVWTRPLIDMRFNYRPENPLYLLLVRVYRLSSLLTVDHTPAYAGCKSWVPLDEPVALDAPLPVVADDDYARRCESIRQRITSAI